MTRGRKILMVVANPSVSTTTGWPVGFWASELIHPYDAFVRQGYEVTIASPKGGKVELDAYSDPRDASGYSKDDSLSLAYLARPEFVALLERTARVSDLRAKDFDAIVVAGGQSPMFTFREARNLQDLFKEFYSARKVSAVLCHGTCLLLYLTNADGTPFVKGRKMTGFANSEEDYADKAVGQKLMPFRIEDEAKRLGAQFTTASAFQPYAVRDGNLITGQQQHSGAEVARLVMEALDEKAIWKIAFIGIGNVGGALASRLAQIGHEVAIAARDMNSEKVRGALNRSPRLKVKRLQEGLTDADLVFLATPFDANEKALCEAGDLTGKILVDCTNPIGPGLTHGLESKMSGGEYVQKLVPGARVVKAFTIYGFENFQDSAYPGYGELKPAMLIAGNDPAAKAVVSDLCTQLGWQAVDTGDIRMSLHLEHMTLLWVKMGRIQGRGAGFVWAMLTR